MYDEGFFWQLDEGGIKGGNWFSPLSLPTQYLQHGVKLGVGILCKKGGKLVKRVSVHKATLCLGERGGGGGLGDEKPQQPASNFGSKIEVCLAAWWM